MLKNIEWMKTVTVSNCLVYDYTTKTTLYLAVIGDSRQSVRGGLGFLLHRQFVRYQHPPSDEVAADI